MINTSIDTELKQSFLSYAMSVIVSRALPDVRDGLKPVHRRILFAMNQLGISAASKYVKSARVVGEVIGKYHPHGDSAVYDSMVRMAQDFSLRYPLVNGQGNFGSIDGDNAAAYRYTEARLTKLSEDLLEDLDKDTVVLVPNFDELLKEPSVLPAKAPNLLINGSTGIAVGMATNMPPHNLREVCEGVIALIQNPTLDDLELMQYVKGPDFPTGGLIYGRAGIALAYKTGCGKVILRARTHIEEVRNKQAIIVDEIPYQVNKSALVEQIAQLVKDKLIEGISDLRDESDRDGMRVVIELKKDAVTEIVLNQLFKLTRLQTSFGIINLCLVNNSPRVLTLKQIINYFIDHRVEVVVKRTQFELTKAEKKAHILLGLKTALDHLDAVITLIRQAKSAPEAKEQLMQSFPLDEIQAQAILEMRLQRLTGLEREKLLEDYNQTIQLITHLKSILASREKILNIIVEETKLLIEKYTDNRRTEIIDAQVDVDIEDLIADEDVVVSITQDGYIKRVSLDTYRLQNRGGRGIMATTTKEDDTVKDVFVSHSKAFILFFTNKGNVHWLKAYKIPEGSRQSRGRAIVNLLELEKDETVSAVIPIKVFDEQHSLLLCTKNGTVKKTSLESYSRPRQGGIIAIKLLDGDELISAQLTNGNEEVIIATKLGQAIRFHESDAREVGRVSQGVRGIRLEEGDSCVGMVIADDTKQLLSITKNGYGKRSQISEYRLIGRGGKGVINIQTTERNGPVVSIQAVDEEKNLLLISRKGIVIRIRCDQISLIGRNTQGVRLMRLDDDDEVVGCAKIDHFDTVEATPNPVSSSSVNIATLDSEEHSEKQSGKHSDEQSREHSEQHLEDSTTYDAQHKNDDSDSNTNDSENSADDSDTDKIE